jgi:glycosyltransferase involved in cell wall biosynthesis
MERTALRPVVTGPTTIAVSASSALPAAATGLRLTVVHIASGDLWAGAEVQLFNLACTLDADPQIRLFVILLNPGRLAERLQERGVSVQVFDEGRLNAGQVFTRVYRFLKQVRPDIVHTHRQKENVIGAIAARLTGAKSVRTVHGAEEHRPQAWQWRRRLQKTIDRVCARHLQAAVVAVSHELRDALGPRQQQDKLHVVENGLDIDRLHQTAALRVEWPGRSDAVKVGLVGRLVPVKRVDIFLTAAQILCTRYPGVFQFYVFGDGPLMEETREDIARRGLQHQVLLMGFTDPIAPYLARLDLLCITSDHEGLPMNLLEALGLEVPIIAHAVGGIPQALDEGRCGTLVHRQQAQAYADAMQAYLPQRSTFIQKAKEGHARARARYSALANARAFKSLYAQLSGRGDLL